VSARQHNWTFHADVFASALQRFRTHPLQTWLTVAGLVVGTGSIVLVVALGLTGRGYVMSQIEGVGSHLVWATYQGTVTAGVSRREDDQIRDGDARAIAAYGQLFAGVTPLVIMHGQTTVQSRATDLTILGTTANYPKVRKNVRLLRGRFLDQDDVETRAKVCVVNRHLYEELFGAENELGKTVRSLGMAFAVIGEFEEPVDTLGQGDVTPETIFIPITTAWLFAQPHRVDVLFAEARDFRFMGAAARTVRDVLRERHQPGSEYDVQTMAAVVRVARAISAGLIAVFILIAAVSVVVGGVGIMNIMIASVERRTSEIGLRLALGARRRDILLQFLLEALVLGVVGSAIGALGGMALPSAVRLLVPAIPVKVSALSALAAFAFSCGVAMVFGIVPAARAARLDPVEALRHE
jgi:putative ABC transport system permease protein